MWLLSFWLSTYLLLHTEGWRADCFILKVSSMNDAFIFQKLYFLFNELDDLEFLSKCFAVKTPLSQVKAKRRCKRLMALILSKRKRRKQKWSRHLLKTTQQFRGNSDRSLTQWTCDDCTSQVHIQQGKRDEQLRKRLLNGSSHILWCVRCCLHNV